MAIPEDKYFRLPILRMMADNEERHKSEIFDYLDEEFQFTDEDKAQQLSSGNLRLANRIGWALTHLKHANLLENTAWCRYKITEQ